MRFYIEVSVTNLLYSLFLKVKDGIQIYTIDLQSTTALITEEKMVAI